MPTENLVTLAQFTQHLADVQVDRRIEEIVVHHCWSPSAADYKGIETIRGVRRYHQQVRGWSDNGYHVMVAPNTDIFLCRPISRSGAHVQNRNAHTIGVSFVANFDRDEPTDYPGLVTGHCVVAALLERFDLSPTNIRFHREFASKTCPGMKLYLAQFRNAVVEAMEENGPVKVVLLPDSEIVGCRPRLEAGVTRCDLRPLAEALGYSVYDHLKDQGKVYVRLTPPREKLAPVGA